MARWLKELFLSLFRPRLGGAATTGFGADRPVAIPQTQGVGEVGESLLSFSEVLLFGRLVDDLTYKNTKNNPKSRNRFLEEQIEECDDDNSGKANFARIYGFSYDGVYFELPAPALFLVRGPGKPVNEIKDKDGNVIENAPGDLASRAPNDPGRTGVAAADFQFSNDVKVWDYDKSDYTIRMDVMNGQFEEVLLDVYFGVELPSMGGAKVSGAKVSGAKVSGAKVSGAKVSGAKVSGAKARGGD
ncbi:hypothetical protein M3P21_03955 [Ruegeria sp. 2012CJ41-6]|uniref:Uncharacterized protein n=1 Tax=Ruegeria spongiae TaxID=2942209 RepID=A0ABT0PYI4_9RHOB|nr:hypothetical protein [Ruegeria spongiae]MCL6282676.1 hypothetical protein [Ruegeria spongiae]